MQRGLAVLQLVNKGGEKIFEHQFFNGIVFEDILEKKIKAPWKPFYIEHRTDKDKTTIESCITPRFREDVSDEDDFVFF